MNARLLRDIAVGAFITGLFSYFASTYEANPNYLKITAYMWGVPVFFFYLLYVVWSNGGVAVLSFTKHALLGTSLTVLAMLITLSIYPMGELPVILINIGLLSLFIWAYLSYEVYTMF